MILNIIAVCVILNSFLVCDCFENRSDFIEHVFKRTTFYEDFTEIAEDNVSSQPQKETTLVSTPNTFADESEVFSDSPTTESPGQQDSETFISTEISVEPKLGDVLTVNEGQKRKSNSNPSVDEIISGIIQLIGGNVKLGRPLQSKPQLPPIVRPVLNTHYIQLPIHPTRINNRGPPQLIVPAVHDYSNFIPPSILIGPAPAGLPLPLPPPLSQPSKTIPLHLIPTKTQVNIAESDVSFLFGLIKPKNTEEVSSHTRKQVISEPSVQQIQPNSTVDETTITSSVTSSISDLIDASKPTPILESVSQNVSVQSNYIFNVSQTRISINKTDSVSTNTSVSDENLVSSNIVINQSSNSVPNGPITDWVPFFVQPTVQTTNTWLGEPPPIITKPEEPQVFDITVKHKLGAQQETKAVSISSTTTASINSTLNEHSTIAKTSSTIKPTLTSKPFSPSRIAEPDIVYGRPVGNVAHSIRPSFASNTSNSYKHRPTKVASSTSTATTSLSKSSSSQNYGKPIVIPVEVDEVKPQIGGITPAVITEAGAGSVFIDGKPKHFKIRPNFNHGPTLQVGSGVTVNIDNEVPGRNKLGLNPKLSAANNNSSRPSVVRRPPFRLRPNTPLVRIDTCIVGDDSTCGITLNEKCKTELGISSCQCKPGYGRTTPRGMCSPISSMGISMKIDRLSDNKITFNKKYLDSDSEEYQYLEYETLQALNSLFSLSRFSKLFMGAKVNKFYSMAGKTVVNATIELEMNNATRSNTMRKMIQQELTRVIATNNNNIGESKLYVEGSLNAIPRVEDINECSSADLHDCPKHADCFNEFGSFRCVCKHGFEDKYPKDPLKAGRFCASCSPQYCSNRGECLIINGERECKCKGNFIGSKCDIDGEVLGVALGGSVAALIIIMITFICLYMWNQRWKKEQQKMEAMSSGSGQTFSYVNKQAVSNGAYRYTMDDRIRWAQMSDTITTNPTYNYYVNAEQLMTTSQQHVYATPSRVQTPDALLSEESCPSDSRHCPRYTRTKSRSSAVMPYQSMGYGPGSVYNETEFSTRETLYTPSHLIVNPRSKCVVYN